MLNKISKNSVIAFLLGVIVGIFMTFMFLGGMYAVYKVGKKIFGSHGYKVSKPVVSSGAVRLVKKGKKFNLGFENKKDLEFFTAHDGLYMEQSKEFATQGKYSLLAEYPKGATYPGLYWEVYNKRYCLNWSGANYFIFDVYNSSETDAMLIIKLKSGANYPKSKYQTYVHIPAKSSKKAKISIDKLRNKLDVSEISYINFFIDKPRDTITLYFDNIHLVECLFLKKSLCYTISNA